MDQAWHRASHPASFIVSWWQPLPHTPLSQEGWELHTHHCVVTRTTPTNTQSWDFPGGPAAKTPSFSAGGPGSIHCQGARSSKHMATHSHPYTEPQPTTQSCCLVAQLCLTLCDPTGCSTPGLPVSHPLLKFAQVHAHCISDAIQPSHPLSSPSPPALSLSQHQCLFQ